jgi:glutamine synthetase
VARRGRAARLPALYKVLSKAELDSRAEIFSHLYITRMQIEAETMVGMARQLILPAALRHQQRVAEAVAATESAGVDATDARELLQEVADLVGRFRSQTTALDSLLSEVPHDAQKGGRYIRDEVFPAMEELRTLGDSLEDIVAADLWPMPTYRDLLSVR